MGVKKDRIESQRFVRTINPKPPKIISKLITALTKTSPRNPIKLSLKRLNPALPKELIL